MGGCLSSTGEAHSTSKPPSPQGLPRPPDGLAVRLTSVAADLPREVGAGVDVGSKSSASLELVALPQLTAANATTSSVAGSTLKSLNSFFRTITLPDNGIGLQDPDQLLRHVELAAQLGSGASGLVYRGQYQGAGVAVKLVAAECTESQLREALLSPQLHHPNIVHTYAARAALMTAEFLDRVHGETCAKPQSSTALMLRQDSGDGLGDPRRQAGGLHIWSEVLARLAVKPGQVLILLVQEFCTLGSLATALRGGVMLAKPPHTSERVARRMVLRTAAEVCRGMVSLHEANVIHGDLKPGNILLAPSCMDRRGFIVKVADFGMSRVLMDLNSWAEASNPGTIAYSSPEALGGQQCRGSDVYSFGVMLYELMTGNRPFPNLTTPQVMLGVACQDLRPAWPEAQWPELCAVARRCCAAEPTQRPGFRELERELVEMEAAIRERQRLPAPPGKPPEAAPGKGADSAAPDPSEPELATSAVMPASQAVPRRLMARR